MKFHKTCPVNGDTKIKTFFAWWPVTVWNFPKKETRWWEKVKVKYKYITGWEEAYWYPVEFIDLENK